MVENLQVDLAEVGAAIDDDVVEDFAELTENATNVVNGDQVGEFRADRRQQHLYASRPIHHDLTDEIGVHVVDVLDQVGDSLRVVQVQEHADVAKLEVQVDERHLALGFVRH